MFFHPSVSSAFFKYFYDPDKIFFGIRMIDFSFKQLGIKSIIFSPYLSYVSAAFLIQSFDSGRTLFHRQLFLGKDFFNVFLGSYPLEDL